MRIEEAKKMASRCRSAAVSSSARRSSPTWYTNKLCADAGRAIEKEKKELAERLRLIHRRMDHLSVLTAARRLLCCLPTTSDRRRRTSSITRLLASRCSRRPRRSML